MARAGLSRARVVAEAADVVDATGKDGLTLAAVATRCGVRLPSLYKHVAGLDALHRDLAVLAIDELGAALATAAVGRSRDDALRGLADAYRGYAHAHPGRYEETLRAPAPDDAEHVAAAERILATVFAVLRGYGLDGDDLVDATRTLRAALHGFVALEAAGGFGLPRDVDRSFERLVDGLAAAYARR